ncbi:Cell division protein FtsA [uncultured bacterium]|nr:Cell division protein FtsA [uncultured bacterium]
MKNRIIAGLDLGTTKVCAAIAEATPEGVIRILGVGVAPSEGLHKGLVANIGKTADAIRAAVNIASNRAGITIKSVNVGVAGEHITSLRHRNYVNINHPDGEIREEDLERLNQDINTLKIPADRQILHVIPEEFFIDHQGGIESPVGMSGSRLEAVNHIVMAAIPAIQNIRKSVERAGLDIADYMLQPIASSNSVLEENEKDLGVLLIDIGGGTTDIAIIHNKAIKHSKVFGIAGNQVTSDIREALGIITAEAEAIKKRYGNATVAAVMRDETIPLQGIGARGNTSIPVSLLAQIIEYRMRELFSFVDNELKNTGMKSKIKAGVVLTGGGSMLNGCTALVEEVLGLPAKVGVPLSQYTGNFRDIEKPEFATAVGLLQSFNELKNRTKRHEYGKPNVVKKKSSSNRTSGEGMVTKLINTVKDFIKDL